MSEADGGACPHCGDPLECHTWEHTARHCDPLRMERLARSAMALRIALREVARRIYGWHNQHSQPDACAVVSLAMKTVEEVIAPVLGLGEEDHGRSR